LNGAALEPLNGEAFEPLNGAALEPLNAAGSHGFAPSLPTATSEEKMDAGMLAPCMQMYNFPVMFELCRINRINRVVADRQRRACDEICGRLLPCGLNIIFLLS